MNQIAIGSYDPIGEWLVLHGEGIIAPFKQADYQPVFGTGEEVAETIQLSLEGTPNELAEGVAALETIRQRNLLYHQTGYPAPQCLRFQMTAGDGYYYCLLNTLEIQANPDSPQTRLTGSLLLTLHFTRANHYDADPVELPLTVGSVEDVLGGADLINHTDAHSGHVNSVLIKPGDFNTDLPAPLRLELINTNEAGVLHDAFVGIYHHPEALAERKLFCYAGDFSGGTALSVPDGVNERYLRVTWSETEWKPLGGWYFDSDRVKKMAGLSFRPVLRFYNMPANEDLYLRLNIQSGLKMLWEGESVYVDPDYGYVLFPPIQIPPNKLLNETQPHPLDLFLYGLHETDAAYTIDFDCLTFLPLEPGANFLAFYEIYEDGRLLDENFLNRHTANFSSNDEEIVAHIRQGAPLTLFPGHYHRLFVMVVDENNEMDIFRTFNLRLYYRPRKRIL
ncbi:hypothetical protein JR338_06830 [Chloroflexota bacterium]|nr:hypothetical protein JR338_06830 [Chloroflexota bacterium]